MEAGQLGTYGPLIINALKALAFLIVGWIVAGALSRFVRHRLTQNPNIDDTLGSFFASILKWVVLLVVLIAVLQVFGFEATSLVAILGAATLARAPRSAARGARGSPAPHPVSGAQGAQLGIVGKATGQAWGFSLHTSRQ